MDDQEAERSRIEHSRYYQELYRAMPIVEPPAPWKRIVVYAVGGLTEVGYGENTDLLLVVSGNGRGVFDCLTGQKVARDYEDPCEGEWYQPIPLRATGIGPLANMTIRVAGLHGGGLPNGSEDGWSFELISPDWPDSNLILQPPSGSVYVERFSEGYAKITRPDSIRAYGFSDTGRSFIMATSHSLEIFGRGAS